MDHPETSPPLPTKLDLTSHLNPKELNTLLQKGEQLGSLDQALTETIRQSLDQDQSPEN